jgi:lipopolysaccharide transport system ATP-binding protein
MSDIAIKAENLSKLYQIGNRESYKALRDVLSDAIYTPFRWLKTPNPKLRTPNSNHIWALKDISFEVKKGEVVGIIGRNGAGKSTLLRILSRITEPTEGYVKIYGRVGSLLEVGTGFHPELTGRENIYLNGAILGMGKADISRKFDEIVAFAEVEKFIDTPVKHYSSGMYMRLAFSVAAHLEPEVLLVDEVLAVGDVGFQEKCLGKMESVASGGRTVLFVSHNMASVSALCSRVYFLHKGSILASGQPKNVIEEYLNEIKPMSGICLRERTDRHGNGRLQFAEMVIRDDVGDPIDTAVSGQDIAVKIAYISSEATPLRNVSISVGFYSALGQFLFYCGNEMTGNPFRSIPPKGEITCSIPRLPLSPGRYVLNLHCEVNGILSDWVQQAGHITVAEGDFFRSGRLPPSGHGGMLVPHSWNYEGVTD